MQGDDESHEQFGPDAEGNKCKLARVGNTEVIECQLQCSK